MFDIIIRKGSIIDGNGTPAYTGDIGIRKDTIEEIGDLSTRSAGMEIDAENRVVSPGFIDIHSHADITVPREDHDTILKPLVMQGITTFVGGNCGFSNSFIPEMNREISLNYLENLSGQSQEDLITWTTPAEFMEMSERRGLLLNMALLIGHGSLRIAAAGSTTQLLNSDERSRMKGLLNQALEMGCLGLSTGLQYFPGSQSDTEELVELGSTLKKHNGIFTSHLRSYSHTIDQAIDEVGEVGRQNGIRVQISHLYWQPYSRGLTGITKGLVQLGSFLYNRVGIPIPIEQGLVPKLKRIEKMRDEGIDIHFDMVPTSQGFTELTAFLPPYVLEGSKAKALERLKDTSFRKEVLHDIEKVEPEWPHRDRATWSFNYIKMTGWNGLRVMAVAGEKNRWMEGKSFPEIGKEVKKHPFDVICDLLIEEQGHVLVFHTPTVPDDPFAFRSMWRGFTHPLSVPVTDTILLPIGRPSHVFYDCFPRFIDFFVKKRGLLTLEEAIRKSTATPAMIMDIPGRGTIKTGNYADLIVFDPEKLGTRATFYTPSIHPTGIDHVIINGRAVVSEGVFQKGTLTGRVLRRR